MDNKLSELRELANSVYGRPRPELWAAENVNEILQFALQQAEQLESAQQRIAELEIREQWHSQRTASFDILNRKNFEIQERVAKAEAELARLRAQELVSTKLVYSSVLPKFIGDTDEVESYSCYIHGSTPPRKTMAEAYADADEMCGPLYAEPLPAAAVVPPEMEAEPDKHGVIAHGFIAGYNKCRADAIALSGQPQKPVDMRHLGQRTVQISGQRYLYLDKADVLHVFKEYGIRIRTKDSDPVEGLEVTE